MDIDLFLSPHGECGLLCNSDFDDLPAGVIFDAETKELTLEFLEGNPFHLNIPIEELLQDSILMSQKLYVAFLDQGFISDSIETPVLFLNDPYGGEFDNHSSIKMSTRSVINFQEFMKRCTFAQPVHRDNLDDEDTGRSILRGINPKQLQFAPQLLRQQRLEAALDGPSGPAPMGPRGPAGPMPMGPGGANSGASFRTRQPPRRPPTKKSDDDDN